MKSITLAIAALVCFVGFTSEASAKHYRHHHTQRSFEASSQCSKFFMPCEGVTMTPRAEKFVGSSFGGPVQTYHVSGGRPHAWCGWYMRQRKGIADASYNLAANWAHYGHSVSPQPGAVVVWRHHVGELVSQVSGSIWMVHSGNDGHAVRTRARSIAGAIAIRA